MIVNSPFIASNQGSPSASRMVQPPQVDAAPQAARKKSTGRKLATAGAVGGALMLPLLTTGCGVLGFGSVPPDQWGVIYNNYNGQVIKVVDPGWNEHVPMGQSLKLVPKNPQVVDIGNHHGKEPGNEAQCTTKMGERILLKDGMDVDVNYIIPKEGAGEIIGKWGSYESFSTDLKNLSRDSMREVCSAYSLSELEGEPRPTPENPSRTSRDMAAADLQKRVALDLTARVQSNYGADAKNPVIITVPNIRQVYTPDFITDARNKTAAAAQEVATSANELQAESNRQQKAVVAAEKQEDVAKVNVRIAKLKTQAADEMSPRAMHLEELQAIQHMNPGSTAIVGLDHNFNISVPAPPPPGK